ncbi:hypothetical protein ACC808_36975, partial [Rhizobium ruizarguesonis]
VRGGLLLDIYWRNGMPTMVTLSAVRSAIAKLRFGQRTWNVDLRDVAVMDFGSLHIPIFQPLLQLASRADPVWRNSKQDAIEVRDEIVF